MIRIAALCAALLGVAACSGLPTPDAAAVDARAGAIEARIVKACTGSGLFKMADGMLSAAVPVAGLPVAVVNAGVDQVCADPARFARDASTAEWVAKNLADIVKARAAQR